MEGTSPGKSCNPQDADHRVAGDIYWIAKRTLSVA